MEFLPDDGHIHQYLNGECTWCGAPPADNPLVALAEGAREAGAQVTETSFTVTKWEGEEHVPVPDPGSTAILAAPIAAMLEAGCVFEVSGQTYTLQAFCTLPLADIDMTKYAAEATRVLEWAKSLEIVDNASAKLVAGDLRSIAKLRRDVDQRIAELMARISNARKQMIADLATVSGPIAEANQISRQKVTAWDAKQRQVKADAEEATRKIAEAAALARKVTDAGGVAPDLTVEPVDIPEDRGPIRPEGGGTISMVDHWSAEVTDKHSIPSEYMEPNMQMLNLKARQCKGSDPIPGVRWVNNPKPSVR